MGGGEVLAGQQRGGAKPEGPVRAAAQRTYLRIQAILQRGQPARLGSGADGNQFGNQPPARGPSQSASPGSRPEGPEAGYQFSKNSASPRNLPSPTSCNRVPSSATALADLLRPAEAA